MNYITKWNETGKLEVYTDDENYLVEITVGIDHYMQWIPGTVCDFNELKEYVIEDWELFAWDKKEFVPVTENAEALFEELFGEFDIDKFIKAE
jgi:hypothetical protein